jgi:hypothetical protein
MGSLAPEGEPLTEMGASEYVASTAAAEQLANVNVKRINLTICEALGITDLCFTISEFPRSKGGL